MSIENQAEHPVRQLYKQVARENLTEARLRMALAHVKYPPTQPISPGIVVALTIAAVAVPSPPPNRYSLDNADITHYYEFGACSVLLFPDVHFGKLLLELGTSTSSLTILCTLLRLFPLLIAGDLSELFTHILCVSSKV